MNSLQRMLGMLEQMMSVVDEAPGIPGHKQITPEMVKEGQRRAQEWLAAHPADSEPGQPAGESEVRG